jgi:hypothetical protein
VADIGCEGCCGDHYGGNGRDLQHSYPASRKGVLQALANGNTDTHRLLHHNDVRQREGEQK